MFIEKTYHVEYAHRLADHPGLCCNLHGHCGVVTIQLEGLVEEESGMVVDFGDLLWLKDIVMQFDHATVLDGEDPLCDVLVKAYDTGYLDQMRVVLLEDPPTAENFCSYLAGKIQGELYDLWKGTGLRLKSISFQETVGNRAVQEFN